MNDKYNQFLVLWKDFAYSGKMLEKENENGI